MALLVNPMRNMSIIKVGFVVEKMPNNLISKSRMMIASIVLPMSHLSARQPQRKVPINAEMVLRTRQ